MSRIRLASLAALLILPATLRAQEQPQVPGPQQEHQWLQKFVGEWSTHSKASVGPDQPEMECSGTITSRALGGLWVVNEMKGSMGEFEIHGLQTIGYDPQKEKYVGTWVDSMVNHLWHYEGTVDESGKKLTLEAEGPNHMAGGKLTKFRDAYEFVSDDKIIVTASMQGEDGEWVTFMTGEATRKKGSDVEAQ
jgi:hypothetical protein